MVVRAAVEADAPAMGQVTVESYLAAHRGQMPDVAWSKRAVEWTPELSARAWAATVRELAAEPAPSECLFVAVEGGSIVGVAMGGPAEQAPAGTGEVFALYVGTGRQGHGVGRLLLQAVAAFLVQQGMTALQIACLAANTPARRFYEALGGRVAGERQFDEYGLMLPEVVYWWADLSALAESGQPDTSG